MLKIFVELDSDRIAIVRYTYKTPIAIYKKDNRKWVIFTGDDNCEYDDDDLVRKINESSYMCEPLIVNIMIYKSNYKREPEELTWNEFLKIKKSVDLIPHEKLDGEEHLNYLKKIELNHFIH